jgi:hypothetical protein
MAFGNDVATMTPGSAVADSLEDILTRKRNEARQAMLDSITRQSAQARANYENSSAASLAEQRAAQAQFRQSEANKNRMAAMGPNPSSVDKATYDWGSKVSPSSFSMTPGGPTLASTQISDAGTQQVPSTNSPATFQYLGSPQYRQRQDTIKGLQSLTTDPAFANNPALQAELKVAAADPNWNPEAGIARVLTSKTNQGPGRIIFANEATGQAMSGGKPVTDFNSTDHIVAVPRPPQMPAAEMPYISGTMEDPVTHAKTPATFRVTPNMIGKNGLVTYPAGFTPDGKLAAAPKPPVVKPPKVDDRDWSLYINAKAAALRAPDDPKTEDLLNSQANKVINTATNDPVVKAFLSQAWTYKRARSLPADDLISKATRLPDDPKTQKEAQPLSDQQKEEIRQIWNQLKFEPQGQ